MRALLPLVALLALALPVQAFTVDTGDDHRVWSDPAADLGLFPTADEVHQAIDAARGSPWVTVHELGASEDGRPLTVLEITDPASPVPREQRVVTLLETQQHGNEPAGTGAAIPLLQDILAGKHPADLLRNQVLLLLPMTNPDGATANTRENRDGVDINRDHVALATSEARAVHAVLNQWDVHVAIDHHEYGGTAATGVGNPVPVRLYDFDLTLMYPNHGNVREPTATLSKQLDYDVLWPAAESHGYSVGDYGWTTVNGVKVQQTAGGPDPGILRNGFGLDNVVGLLCESFVNGLPDTPFQSAERRIAIHRLVMETTLQWASDHADELRAAKRESERLNREEPLPEYSEVGQGADLHGPLPPAYRSSADLSALFALHGLPAPAQVDGAFVYPVAGQDRSGLVAAILAPQSSRHVAEASPADLPASLQPAAGEAKDAPAPGLALGLLALAFAVGMAAVGVRRR